LIVAAENQNWDIWCGDEKLVKRIDTFAIGQGQPEQDGSNPSFVEALKTLG
jgi:hypothetical protein